jgi:hypothetical protein
MGGHFNPEKETWYPFYGRLDGSQGRSRRVRKILLPSGLEPWADQSVESRYID